MGGARDRIMASTLVEPITVGTQTAPPSSNVVHFPSGLLGFEQRKKFALVGRTQEAPFLWLEAQDDSRLAFIVVAPKQVAPDYQPEFSDEDTKFLGLNSSNDALVLSIVTLLGHGHATINLKGPLVINAQTRIGKQIEPVNADDYSTEYPLLVAN